MNAKHVDRHPYFDGKRMPDPENLHVCWVDVMGIQSAMRHSLTRTANFVFKLHVAALEAPRSLRLYPVMDGVYAIARHIGDVQLFLSDVLSRLADTFVCEPEPKHRFIVRAGLAYGEVVHGHSLPAGISDTLDLNPAHRDSVILGAAVIDAFTSEHSAPPFGVAVHGSVKAAELLGVGGVPTWQWSKGRWNGLAADLLSALDEYYDWHSKHPGDPAYSADDIAKHKRAAHGYFSGAI